MHRLLLILISLYFQITLLSFDSYRSRSDFMPVFNQRRYKQESSFCEPMLMMHQRQEAMRPAVAQYTKELAYKAIALRVLQSDVDLRRMKYIIDQQLTQVKYTIKNGTTYNRLMGISRLYDLRFSYDPTYQAVQQSLLSYHQGTNEYATLHTKLIAVGFLRTELHSVIDYARQQLFDKKSGRLLNASNRRFVRAIDDYLNQYTKEFKEFAKPDMQVWKKIANHPLYPDIARIDQHLLQGNYTQAREIIGKYAHEKRERKIINSYMQSNPHLSKHGIPKVWKANPKWPEYRAELTVAISKDDVLIRMESDHKAVLLICDQIGLSKLSPHQLSLVYALQEFKNDPSFADFAQQAIKDPAAFDSMHQLLIDRNKALQDITHIIESNTPGTAIAQTHLKELLVYSRNPNFVAGIDSIVKNQASVQNVLKLFAEQHNYVKQIKRTVGEQHFSPLVERVAFKLAQSGNDAQRAQLLGTLSNDNVHEEIRKAYAALHIAHLHIPHIFKYDAQLLNNNVLPDILGTDEFTSERVLCTDVMRQSITSDIQREQAQQYLDILRQACSSTKHREAFRSLAYFTGQTCINSEMQPSLALGRQNIMLYDTIAQAISAGDLATAANSMNILQCELRSNSSNAIHIPNRVQTFIQQHTTITVTEKTVLPNELHQATDESKSAEYARLRDAAQKQHAAVFQKTGRVSQYHLSRENALSLMAQGNHAVRTQHYMLNDCALRKLEQAGIATGQFTECTGTLIQQDTHGKLINAINILTDARTYTHQGGLLESGIIDCAQAGNWFNNAENLHEAMIYSDFCTLVTEHVLPIVNQSGAVAFDAAVLRDAVLTSNTSTQDLMLSLHTLCTNIQAFTAGLASGTLHGLTDIQAVCNGLYNTVEMLGQFASYTAEQSALADALEFGRYNDARHIIAENNQRALRITESIDLLTQQISDFIEHVPDMTAAEWERVGYHTGRCVGEGVAQFGVAKMSMIGLHKIGRGVSAALQEAGSVSRELLFSAQLSGNAAAPSVADIIRQARLKDIPAQMLHSHQFASISTANPKFLGAASTQIGEQCGSTVTAAVVGSSSDTIAAALQTSSHMASSFMELGASTSSSSSSSSSFAISSISATKKKPTTEEKVAQKKIRAAMKVADAKRKQQYSQTCEAHGLPTSGGRHEYTEVQSELKDLIPNDLANEIVAKPYDHTMHTHTHSNLPETFTSNRRSLAFNYEHLSPEFDVHCTKGVISGKGFHHDYLYKIENSGLIEVIDRETLPLGCYQYKWGAQGSALKPSTFFPAEWTRAQAVEKVREALLSENTKAIFYKTGDKYSHLGLTSEGIPVFSVIKIEENTAKVITAYPDFVTYQLWLEGKL